MASHDGIITSYLVTFQIQVRINAPTETFAENALLSGVSVGAKLVPHIFAQGCVAQPLTTELLKEMGIDPNKLHG